MNRTAHRNLSALLLALILPLFVFAHTACADAFRWLDNAGTLHSLDEYRGKPVIVHIWASWCPPCRAEMPEMSAWLQAHPEIPFVPVSVDESAQNAEDFLSRQKIHIPLFLTEAREASALGIRGLPSTLVFDASGVVKRQFLGSQSWADAEFSAALLKDVEP